MTCRMKEVDFVPKLKLAQDYGTSRLWISIEKLKFTYKMHSKIEQEKAKKILLYRKTR